jgi:subfamily B ATP-binding cassette protein MsbA
MFLKISTSVNALIKTTKFWQNNYLFLREFKYFPKVVILALVFSFLAATFEGVGIGFLLSFLQSLTNPDAAPIQTGIGWFDVWVLGVNTSATSRFYRISALIWLSTWTRALFNYLANIYTENCQLNFMDRLRKQIFEQLQAVNLSYFATTKSGELINTITSEIEKFKNIFNGSAFLFTRGLTIAIYLMSMVLISWQLSLISIMLFTLMAVGLSTLNKRVRERSFEISTANGKFTTTAIEFISGIRTIQSFATQDFERKRYYKASEDFVGASVRIIRLWAMVKPLAEGIATTILIGMILVAFTGVLTNGPAQSSFIINVSLYFGALSPNHPRCEWNQSSY